VRLRNLRGRDRQKRDGIDLFVYRENVTTILRITPNARLAGGVANHLLKVILGYPVLRQVLHNLLGPEKVESGHGIAPPQKK
jgi:hypothetical protein